MATERQKKAIDNLMENRGNVSKAMRDAGYTAKSAKNPKNLTNSKAFAELVDSIPDDLLIKVHLEGLAAGKKIFKNNNESGEIEMVSEEPDYATRHKYLDSAYKMKGAYAPEKKDITTGGEKITSSDEVKALSAQFDEFLKKETA